MVTINRIISDNNKHYVPYNIKGCDGVGCYFRKRGEGRGLLNLNCGLCDEKGQPWAELGGYFWQRERPVQRGVKAGECLAGWRTGRWASQQVRSIVNRGEEARELGEVWKRGTVL